MAWRIQKTSVALIEAEPLFEREAAVDPEDSRWMSLKSQVRRGDELWTFDSPTNFWREGYGWCGIVLVRDGQYHDIYVLAMS